MSNLDNASTPKRARTSTAIIIAALIVFTSIIVIESSSLQWPLSAELNSIIPPKQNSNNNSTLLVDAASYVPTSISCTNKSSQNGTGFFSPSQTCYPSTPAQEPMVNASILITTFGPNPQLIASNTTNFAGQRLFVLEPNRYVLTFKSSFVNFSTPVLTDPGNTTELDVRVNESSYTCMFFDVSNFGSQSWIGPWDTMFLAVATTESIIQSSNESIFLQFIPTNQATQNQTLSQGPYYFSLAGVPEYGIQIINDYLSPTGGTQWLQVHLDSVAANITSISNIDLLTYSSRYTTREYPMSNTTLAGASATNNATTITG